MFHCIAATTANPLFCLVGLLQLIGLLVAGATRFTQGTPYERTGQWSCFVALGLIGGHMRTDAATWARNSDNECRYPYSYDDDCHY